MLVGSTGAACLLAAQFLVAGSFEAPAPSAVQRRPAAPVGGAPFCAPQTGRGGLARQDLDALMRQGTVTMTASGSGSSYVTTETYDADGILLSERGQPVGFVTSDITETVWTTTGRQQVCH